LEDVEEMIYDEGDEAELAIQNALKDSSPNTNTKQRLTVTGWFIPQMSRYHEGATLSDAARFFGQPREEDQQPSDTPNDHPLRAFAAAMDSASNGSVIRVYAYTASPSRT